MSTTLETLAKELDELKRKLPSTEKWIETVNELAERVEQIETQLMSRSVPLSLDDLPTIDQLEGLNRWIGRIEGPSDLSDKHKYGL